LRVLTELEIWHESVTRFLKEGDMSISDIDASSANAARSRKRRRLLRPSDPCWLTVDEAAGYLGTCMSTLNKMRVYGTSPRYIKNLAGSITGAIGSMNGSKRALERRPPNSILPRRHQDPRRSPDQPEKRDAARLAGLCAASMAKSVTK
jgi:hypothetical protein